MPFLSQTRLPALWLLMQRLIGGNASKKALATEHYSGQSRILEIGCSVGNVSEVFRRFPDVQFVGIDIDEKAIAYARHRFRDAPNFRFLATPLETLAETGETFDYVLFAGILHHVDDATGKQLLHHALRCMSEQGVLVIYEPEVALAKDSWILRMFITLFEQGQYLRTRRELEALVSHAGVKFALVEDRMVSPGIVQRPYVARFNLLVGRRN